MLTFSFSRRQRLAILKTSGGFVGLGAVMALLGQALGHAPVRGVMYMTVAPPICIVMYFLSARNRTVLDERGVYTAGFLRHRHCAWSEVASIDRRDARTGSGPIRSIRITTTSGKRFALGASMSAMAYPDPEFDAKAEQVETFWRDRLAAAGMSRDGSADTAPTIGANPVPPPLTRRGWRVAMRTTAVLGLVIAVSAVLGAVGDAQENLAIRAHGYTLKARVEGVFSGNPTQYQLSLLSNEDAANSIDWFTTFVDGSAKVGDTITVEFTADSDVKDIRVLNRWWHFPAGLLAFSLVLAALSVWLLLRCRRRAQQARGLEDGDRTRL
jgi:hypothetical protein